MKSSKFIIFILLMNLVCSNSETESKKSDCKWPEAGEPSIVIRGGAGRLGNMLFSYLILVGLKMMYGMDPYMPKNKRNLIATYFDESKMEIPEAEKHVCNFEHDFKIFWDNLFESKQRKILETIRKVSGEPELELPRDAKGRIQVPRAMYENPAYKIDFIVHQENFSTFDNYSFPEPYVVWEENNVTRMNERNLTTDHIIYIHTDGMNIGSIHKIPGIAERLDQSLQLKPKYQDMAQKTLRHVINQHLEKVNGSKKKKQNKKKKPKKKPKTASDFIYVGIHARRGDHINYEVEKGITSLKSGYYLEAMEKYRTHFGDKLIFLLISDDIEWAKETFSKRRLQDLYFVSDPQTPMEEAIGHDLAVMSFCNHTIVSRGTFSYWSSFLAGGHTVQPCHFYQYRDEKWDYRESCRRNPMTNPLPRLYVYSG